MRQFQDATGKTWGIEVSTVERKAVLAATNGKVDLFGCFDGTAQAALADPENLVDALFCLCGEQAKKLGVDAVQFAHALVGDALDDASEALMRAVSDFSPRHQRAVMMKTLDRINQSREAMATKALEKVDQIAEEALKNGMESLDNLSAPKPLSESSLNPPLSSESNPETPLSAS